MSPPNLPPDPLDELLEFPFSVPLTEARWARTASAIRTEHPVLAELSFFSLSCWRGGTAVALSRIGDFLVVVFADAQVMLVAMPGARVTPAVRRALFELALTHDVRFISQATAAVLEPLTGPGGCVLVPERDQYDYVYSVERLATLQGSDFKGKRSEERRLHARNNAAIQEGRLTDPWAHEHLIAAFDRWSAAKYGNGPIPEAVDVERRGVLEWPRGTQASEIRLFCLTVDGHPAGVSVVEPLWSGTWLGLVMKCDPGVDGGNVALRKFGAAAALKALGPEGRLNSMQDEGLPGLRQAKTSFHPIHLERKFALIPNPLVTDGGTL